MIPLNPLTFATFLTVLSLAMTVAMVKFSEAWLSGAARSRVRWGVAYAALWVAIIGLLLAFAGLDSRKNLLLIALMPVVWLSVHALLLRFAFALRAAPAPAPARRQFAPIDEEEEKEEEEFAPPAAPPTLWDRILGAITTIVRWAVALLIAAVIMGIGESIPALRRLDLIPYRPQLALVLWTLVATGFAAFMGGIIHLILHGRSREDGAFHLDELKAAWRDGTWRRKTRFRRMFVITSGVFLMLMAGSALLIVFAPPGVKMIVIVAVVYTMIRISIGLGRRAAAL